MRPITDEDIELYEKEFGITLSYYQKAVIKKILSKEKPLYIPLRRGRGRGLTTELVALMHIEYLQMMKDKEELNDNRKSI